MTAFLMIFRRFSKIVPKARRTFPNNFREFPKITEDFQRLPKTFEEDPKMFRWYPNEFKYNYKRQTWYHRNHRYLHIWRYHIFTCEDIISFLTICSPIIGECFDTTIVASSDKEWLQWPIEILVLETVLSYLKRQTWYHRSHRYLHMWRYHIFTCEDIVSFLSICYHSLHHWLLYNKS